MLDTNAKEDYISKITGLSVDEIKKIKASNKKGLT